jgi:phenylacetate-CoA ligase
MIVYTGNEPLGGAWTEVQLGDLVLPYANVEEQRAAHYAHLVSLMPELMGRLSWSRAEIDAYRTKAFREILAHAQAHSPWHAKRTASIDAASATLDDLKRIPVMTKNDLMANWDAIVTIPGATLRQAEEALQAMTDQFYIWDDHVLFTSGGTGGRPGVFVYDWTALATTWGGMSRGMMKYLLTMMTGANGEFQQPRMAAIGAEKSAHGSYVVARVFSNPFNPTHMLSGWRAIDDLVPPLNKIQPQLLSCYPTLIPGLVAAVDAGALKISPNVIYFGAEQLTDNNRKLARRAWPGAEILTCWGTSEGGGTFPCPCGDGYHISEDLVVIEPVDAEGKPVKPGQKSAGIYFTNLFNKALPLLRYYIDDVFELEDKPCPCGSAFQKVRQVHGRSIDTFRYGQIAVNPVALDLAVLEQPRITEYQIRQTAHGAHLAYRSDGEVDTKRIVQKFSDALLSYGVADPQITLEEITHLERTTAGKLKRFVPLPR